MDRKIRRGQIYLANLEPIIGSEQGGIRPVLIIQNNKGNKHSGTTIVAPITTRRIPNRLPVHVYTFAGSSGLPQNSSVNPRTGQIAADRLCRQDQRFHNGRGRPRAENQCGAKFKI